ncbi:peptidase [Nocardioides sp. Root1257]|uniref:KPN_02809 family neutral zinc metallopeptidase n=1 Tax=unclassified Nocardioides TaxID=2615069 RepID=UPI0006FE6521|nr:MULTISPECIES: neutral zinc metallopeptidase [unclassified Nocardioides]KQW52843.1 peptidase [Nocardioides sp. Root1257]KRC55531.1 peptidase [Nocardioides sp. Root224]
MRFNPKARLDTSRMGDAGRSGAGRSGGGGGIPIPGGAAGGGIGTLIIIVIVVAASMLLGGGSDGGGQATDTGRYQGKCESGKDANDSTDCARVAIENSLSDYWSDTLPDQSGTAFEPERKIETFTDGISTGCGSASAAVGPFYCPVDRTIYLDTTFYDEVLERQLGGPDGGFVEAYVLAHEYGHHIQNLLGTMGKVKTQQGAKSDAVRLELQADCYAGMWAKSATATQDTRGNTLFSELTDADIQQAIDAATAVGDDRIQQQSGGDVDPESWTHGSAKSRVKWFMTGYTEGTLDACDTFAAGAL